MIEDFIACNGMVRSATDNPKNLCGILIGVIEMKGMLSTGSFDRM